MRLANTGAFPFNELDFFLSIDIYEWYDELFLTYSQTSPPLKIDFNYYIRENWKTHEIDLYKHGAKIPFKTIKIDFEDQIKELLNKIIVDSVKLIHVTIEKLLFSGQDYISYLEQIKYQYKILLQYDSIKKFSFLTNYLQNIKDEMDKIGRKSFVNYSSPKVPEYSQSISVPSYLLLPNESEIQRKKAVKELYTLLIEGVPLIESSEEEFINGFSGKEVVNGIKWLVKATKNKAKISKPSLIYFIQELINNKLLNADTYHNENQYLLYVFRDDKGKCWTSPQLSSAKYAMSENPAQKNRIDDIIQSLKKFLHD